MFSCNVPCLVRSSHRSLDVFALVFNFHVLYSLHCRASCMLRTHPLARPHTSGGCNHWSDHKRCITSKLQPHSMYRKFADQMLTLHPRKHQHMILRLLLHTERGTTSSTGILGHAIGIPSKQSAFYISSIPGTNEKPQVRVENPNKYRPIGTVLLEYSRHSSNLRSAC